jgi:hypothetical protein
VNLRLQTPASYQECCLVVRGLPVSNKITPLMRVGYCLDADHHGAMYPHGKEVSIKDKRNRLADGAEAFDAKFEVHMDDTGYCHEASLKFTLTTFRNSADRLSFYPELACLSRSDCINRRNTSNNYSFDESQSQNERCR